MDHSVFQRIFKWPQVRPTPAPTPVLTSGAETAPIKELKIEIEQYKLPDKAQKEMIRLQEVAIVQVTKQAYWYQRVAENA